MASTFTIVKPDAVAAGNTGNVLAHLEKEGFKILGTKMLRLTEAQAHGFYEVHAARPFFPETDLNLSFRGAIVGQRENKLRRIKSDRAIRRVDLLGQSIDAQKIGRLTIFYLKKVCTLRDVPAVVGRLPGYFVRSLIKKP